MDHKNQSKIREDYSADSLSCGGSIRVRLHEISDTQPNNFDE
jgi:hypothetical protein